MNRRGLLASLLALPAAPLLAKVAAASPASDMIVEGTISTSKIVAGTIRAPRMVFGNDYVQVFDAKGVERVRLGTW